MSTFILYIQENFAERKIETNKSAGVGIKSDLVVVKEEIEARRQEKHKNHVLSGRELAPIEVIHFIVINLPENLVAVFGAERFQLIYGIEIEQEFVDVTEVVRNSARQDDRFIATDKLVLFNRLNALDIFKTRQVWRVADDANNFGYCTVKFFSVNVFVTSVRRVVTAGKIYGGNA